MGKAMVLAFSYHLLGTESISVALSLTTVSGCPACKGQCHEPWQMSVSDLAGETCGPIHQTHRVPPEVEMWFPQAHAQAMLE